MKKLTKKEQKRFNRDVQVFLTHSCILNLDLGSQKHILQDHINTVESSLFSREIKDETILKLKQMNCFV